MTTDTYHVRLVAARKAAGLCQRDAARVLGMSRGRLGRIEAGRTAATMGDALAFTVAYRVSLAQIYGLAPIEVG